MKIPVIRGLIERRILVNYRVDPEVLAATLPEPFRPKLVDGMGMAGICLIRLARVRPKFMPAWVGIASENAAHRVAVEWGEGSELRGGVFVRRRDTSSRLNALAGGRVFPGEHHHADFEVQESRERYAVRMRSDDGDTSILLRALSAERFSSESVFSSLDEASAFFQGGSLGYSTTTDLRRFQGLELRCEVWQMEPLAVEEVRSSFFDDEDLFPRGSIQFDCALLMRNIEHEWHGRQDLLAMAVTGGCGGPARFDTALS